MKFFHGEMRSKSAIEGESILQISVGINYNLKRFLMYNCTVLDIEYFFKYRLWQVRKIPIFHEAGKLRQQLKHRATKSEKSHGNIR